ncbi:MAG TPA: SDR family oxidoreductase [Chloroflexota bacterium]
MDLGLKGKIALVTGGSDGIGRGVALRLAEEGAKVAICARREAPLREAADDIAGRTGAEVLPVVADVTKPADIERFVRAAVERFGRIDVLVNNAGSSASFPFEEVSDDLWEQDINLKVMAAIRMSRLCVPEMRKAGGGRIVNITMIRGKAPGARSVPTSVSRAAGIALTKALSKDLAADKILVNTVCVGVIRSGQWERRFQTMRDRYSSIDQFYADNSKDIPLGRYGLAEEVGDLVAFLASERAGYITGDAINIDGGTSSVV